MIRLAEPASPLDARQQFALDVLIDLSRLLRAADAASPSVVVRVGEPAGQTAAARLDSLRAGAPGYDIGEGSVSIPRGLLDAVAAVVGAVDEQRSPTYDRYGRVPSTASSPVRAGCEREPVVQTAAVALRSAVIDAARGRRVVLLAPWPEGRRWAMCLTHDLDVVSGWPVFTALRALELARKTQLRRVARVLSSALAAAAGDPVSAAVREILAVERTHGIRSTWFVITETPTFATARAGDVTYTPETPRARRIVTETAAAGHEIGLHGSFATYTNATAFARQRARLEQIVGRDVRGVRQHFLRMQPGTTQRAMSAAGFEHDSTFGFADRNGFRLGVADVVPVWDEDQQRALGIDELPFAWMDRALSKYRGEENPDAWIADALLIAEQCRAVDGVWCGIWHPNLTAALGYPDADRAFESLVQSLTSARPWATTVSDIVRWRRARRTAIAVGETNGAIQVRHAWKRAPDLEDQAGRPIVAVTA